MTIPERLQLPTYTPPPLTSAEPPGAGHDLTHRAVSARLPSSPGRPSSERAQISSAPFTPPQRLLLQAAPSSPGFLTPFPRCSAALTHHSRPLSAADPRPRSAHGAEPPLPPHNSNLTATPARRAKLPSWRQRRTAWRPPALRTTWRLPRCQLAACPFPVSFHQRPPHSER